jgi:hypothetical protein
MHAARAIGLPVDAPRRDDSIESWMAIQRRGSGSPEERRRPFICAFVYTSWDPLLPLRVRFTRGSYCDLLALTVLSVARSAALAVTNNPAS